jgi:hypothetical protein
MREISGTDLTTAIRRQCITVVLTTTVIALAAAHALVHGLGYLASAPFEQRRALERFVDMGREANLPTFVSTLNLLLAGGLFALIARLESVPHGRLHWQWWGLAIGFFAMSLDEAAMIHEGLVGTTWTQYFGRGQGITYYSWYQVYIPIVLVIGLLYIPFLRRLPPRYALRFLVAGGVYLSGAIALEMLESYLAGHNLGGRAAARMFEETAEMLGVVLTIDALLLYLADKHVDLRIVFGHGVRFDR